jgi:hypothetical protein
MWYNLVIVFLYFNELYQYIFRVAILLKEHRRYEGVIDDDRDIHSI